MTAATPFGRITTAGVITQFTGGTLSSPGRIIAGPDGNLWFTDEYPSQSIGCITTSGQITEYPVGSTLGVQPNAGLAVGPDGAIWVTELTGGGMLHVTGFNSTTAACSVTSTPPTAAAAPALSAPALLLSALGLIACGLLAGRRSQQD
jgi:virginiamycin B lyase